MSKRGLWAVLLWVGGPLAAQDLVVPTASRHAVVPLDAVEAVMAPALDVTALVEEDALRHEAGLPKRFAVAERTAITPDSHGTWERIDGGRLLWRLRVLAPGATSLNLGFSRFVLPEGASLLLYAASGRSQQGPFTAADNDAHGQYWTPVVMTDDLVVELTIAAEAVPALELLLGSINQGYRGFGTGADLLSGACNMDVECLDPTDPWRDQVRSVGAITVGGTDTCSGSLLNNTAQDLKMYFMTANHCGINSGNAASMIAYWNFENSTCRIPGSGPSGGAGDGSHAEFNSGAIFRAARSQSDFTLVEMDDPHNPAHNLYWGGWDRSTGNPPCSSASLCACIHHPGVDEKRITFSETPPVNSSWGGTPPPQPGDNTHIWVHWDDDPPYFPTPPNVTEGGSSGSPFYNEQHLFIGQLHGGASACGSTGDNLSDIYGRFSVSWDGGTTAATRARDWLDTGNTGVTTLAGRNACTPPVAPTGLGAAPNGDNRIDLDWNDVAGAERYRVYRATGACPGSGWTLIDGDVVGSSYSDLAVLGGVTYSYRVAAYDDGESCESAQGSCDDATATGSCPAPGVPTPLTPADGATGVPRAPTLTWSTATLAETYGAQVATDAAFTNVVFTASGLASPTVTVSPVLAAGTLHYWRANADNICAGVGAYSGAFSFTTGIPTLLLVDDDDDSPDVLATYTAALSAAGVVLDIWDVVDAGGEPGSADLAGYEAVFWFSGDRFTGNATPTAGPQSATETALAGFLDDGNCLLISSQDYLWDMGGPGHNVPTSFMTNYLGLSAGTSDNGDYTSVTGQNFYAGLGPYTLSYPFSDFSDRLTPTASAQVAFLGNNTFNGAISKQGGTWNTTYLSFPFEAIPAASRAAVLDRLLAICGAGDLIFEDGVESNDWSAWDTQVLDGGDLSISGAAALHGAFGISSSLDDVNPNFCEDGTPSNENRYRARFYLDPNSYTPGADGQRIKVLQALEDGPRRLIAVVIRKLGSQYLVTAKSHADDDSWDNTGFFPISDGPHLIEIDWKRSSGASDGWLQLWIDGVPVANLTGLDNDLSSVDFARLGSLGIKAGTTGALLLDAFESRRVTYIGVEP